MLSLKTHIVPCVTVITAKDPVKSANAIPSPLMSVASDALTKKVRQKQTMVS